MAKLLKIATTKDVVPDIAPGVVFLASSNSGWMTGETLYFTGGLR